MHLGYGRSRAGHVGTGPGFNAYALRTSDALWSGGGLEVGATDETFQLACTQYHHLMEGRGMVRAVTKDEFLADPESVHTASRSRQRPSRCIPTSSTRATSGA